MNKRQQGARGEQQAEAYLVDKGMTCLARNLRLPGGEVDLVMRDGAYTVFVEVKARGGTRYGLGREAVDARKQQRIIQVAVQYLAQQGLSNSPARFDVVEVQQGAIRHLPNAFGVG